MLDGKFAFSALSAEACVGVCAIVSQVFCCCGLFSEPRCYVAFHAGGVKCDAQACLSFGRAFLVDLVAYCLTKEDYV
jgi:hypothetical protein